MHGLHLVKDDKNMVCQRVADSDAFDPHDFTAGPLQIKG